MIKQASMTYHDQATVIDIVDPDLSKVSGTIEVRKDAGKWMGACHPGIDFETRVPMFEYIDALPTTRARSVTIHLKNAWSETVEVAIAAACRNPRLSKLYIHGLRGFLNYNRIVYLLERAMSLKVFRFTIYGNPINNEFNEFSNEYLFEKALKRAVTRRNLLLVNEELARQAMGFLVLDGPCSLGMLQQ